MTADAYIQEMLKHADKMISIKIFDPNGKLLKQMPFFMPVHGMFCLFLVEANLLEKYEVGVTRHTWGFHLDPAMFLESLSGLRSYMLAHPELGVDDGLNWQGGLNTHQIVWDFVETLLMAPIDNKCSLIIDHHNEVQCPCALCNGYAPPLTADDVLAIDSFNKIWEDAKIAKMNKG